VLDTLFVISAILGGVSFLLRTVLMLAGVGDDHSFSGDHGGDASHSDHDAGTQLLSIQGVAAFLMMFGLVGLALTRESGVASPFAVAIALITGLASMWLVAKVFSMMTRLQSSGTLDLAHAVGQEGTVYLTVKPASGGQVQISLQGRLGVYEAQTIGDREIATGRAVRVVAVRANQLVIEALPAA
jgi:membrane protein implicated in regulation of membrane protease activity